MAQARSSRATHSAPAKRPDTFPNVQTLRGNRLGAFSISAPMHVMSRASMKSNVMRSPNEWLLDAQHFAVAVQVDDVADALIAAVKREVDERRAAARVLILADAGELRG